MVSGRQLLVDAAAGGECVCRNKNVISDLDGYCRFVRNDNNNNNLVIN